MIMIMIVVMMTRRMWIPARCAGKQRGRSRAGGLCRGTPAVSIARDGGGNAGKHSTRGRGAAAHERGEEGRTPQDGRKRRVLPGFADLAQGEHQGDADAAGLVAVAAVGLPQP
jgi:hypothetical protein